MVLLEIELDGLMCFSTGFIGWMLLLSDVFFAKKNRYDFGQLGGFPLPAEVWGHGCGSAAVRGIPRSTLRAGSAFLPDAPWRQSPSPGGGASPVEADGGYG